METFPAESGDPAMASLLSSQLCNGSLPVRGLYYLFSGSPSLRKPVTAEHTGTQPLQSQWSRQCVFPKLEMQTARQGAQIALVDYIVAWL